MTLPEHVKTKMENLSGSVKPHSNFSWLSLYDHCEKIDDDNFLGSWTTEDLTLTRKASDHRK
jgi:hypothetical protein